MEDVPGADIPRFTCVLLPQMKQACPFKIHATLAKQQLLNQIIINGSLR
jgi:hypothetical protein